jgi:hypothetical protein
MLAMFIFALTFVLSIVVIPLDAQQSQTLVLTGHQGEIPVVQIGGRFFLEIEALARLANGSVVFKGNQIVLTLPRSSGETAATAASQADTSGFSRDFIKASIEEMFVIREWRSTLKTAIERGYPVTEDWVDSYRSRAQQGLMMATSAASTEADHSAVPLLTSEVNNMKQLCDRFLEANKSRTYTPTTALNSDPLDQKILNCAHLLAAMAANNKFKDDGSCR